jgi:hypothetical protein
MRTAKKFLDDNGFVDQTLFNMGFQSIDNHNTIIRAHTLISDMMEGYSDEQNSVLIECIKELIPIAELCRQVDLHDYVDKHKSIIERAKKEIETT